MSINWIPIEELDYTSGEILLYSKSHNQFNTCTFLNRDVTTDNIVVMDGFRGFALKEIKKHYTHYALLTPPKTNQSN